MAPTAPPCCGTSCTGTAATRKARHPAGPPPDRNPNPEPRTSHRSPRIADAARAVTTPPAPPRPTPASPPTSATPPTPHPAATNDAAATTRPRSSPAPPHTPATSPQQSDGPHHQPPETRPGDSRPHPTPPTNTTPHHTRPDAPTRHDPAHAAPAPSPANPRQTQQILHRRTGTARLTQRQQNRPAVPGNLHLWAIPPRRLHQTELRQPGRLRLRPVHGHRIPVNRRYRRRTTPRRTPRGMVKIRHQRLRGSASSGRQGAETPRRCRPRRPGVEAGKRRVQQPR